MGGARDEGHGPSKSQHSCRGLQSRCLGLKCKGSHRKAAPGPGQSGTASRPPEAELRGPAPRRPALPSPIPPAAPLRVRQLPSVRKLEVPTACGGAFNRGRHLWSAWCSQDAGTPGLGRRPPALPPARAEAASGVKVGNLRRPRGLERGFRRVSGGQAAWRPRWLLTGRGPSVEEVGHHLAFALDLDHTPALQLVRVGGQHLVHVCGDLRGKGGERTGHP